MILNRKLLAALALGSLGLVSMACRPARAPEPPPAPRRSASDASPPKVFWKEFQSSLAWPTSSENWFLSKGHYGGTSEALVRVSPAALKAYRELTLGAKLEAGTTLVMLHRSRATGKPGPVHVMQRREDGWEFLLLGPDGAIEQQGELPLCAGCHADAPADSVFGPPPAPAE